MDTPLKSCRSKDAIREASGKQSRQHKNNALNRLRAALSLAFAFALEVMKVVVGPCVPVEGMMRVPVAVKGISEVAPPGVPWHSGKQAAYSHMA